jgi:catechol 2,3-dioxygenase-like lactoylglutathione lyase family enzyme
MAANSPLSYVAKGHHQIAFVVRDLNEAERFFTGKLGVRRFIRFLDVSVQEATYLGAPADFHINMSIGYAGSTQVELFQHLSGHSVYKDFLDKRGPGLHHLGFIVPDYDQAVADFTANGFPVIQSGRVGNNPGVRFAYFDTEAAIGVVTECMVLDEENRRLFEKIKGAPL